MEVVLLGAATQVLLFATLIAAAYTDLVSQRISNWLTGPAILLGLALNWGLGTLEGTPSLTASLQGMGIGFAIFFLAYLVGGVGGGDVKLVTAIGAIMGIPFIISSIFWSAVAGSILASAVLIRQGRFLAGLQSSVRHAFSLRPSAGAAEGPDAAELKIPYGFAIAVGTIWAWFLHMGFLTP